MKKLLSTLEKYVKKSKIVLSTFILIIEAKKKVL